MFDEEWLAPDDPGTSFFSSSFIFLIFFPFSQKKKEKAHLLKILYLTKTNQMASIQVSVATLRY